jgi:hypothetical protein
MAGKTTETNWGRCVRKMATDIDITQYRSHIGLNTIDKMGDDDIYVCIEANGSDKRFVIVGKDICSDRPNFATIAIIKYNHNIGNIFADLYASRTVDYKIILQNYMFYHIKASKQEIRIFANEVLDKMQQVF